VGLIGPDDRLEDYPVVTPSLFDPNGLVRLHVGNRKASDRTELSLLLPVRSESRNTHYE
jgi:hypothetical protein